MTHPMLIVGGIAAGAILTGMSVVAVPHWIASAKDAQVQGDMSVVRMVQSQLLERTGEYASDVGELRAAKGFKVTDVTQIIDSYTSADGLRWCTVAQAPSRSYYAASDREGSAEASTNLAAARNNAKCPPKP